MTIIRTNRGRRSKINPVDDVVKRYPSPTPATENPKTEGKYLCCAAGINKPYWTVLRFAKDLYEVDECHFARYKGKNHSGWYSYDSEWGYYEMSEITHWLPLPPLPQEKNDKDKI